MDKSDKSKWLRIRNNGLEELAIVALKLASYMLRFVSCFCISVLIDVWVSSAELNSLCQHPQITPPHGMLANGGKSCRSNNASTSSSGRSAYGGLPVIIAYMVEPKANKSVKTVEDDSQGRGKQNLAPSNADAHAPSIDEPEKSMICRRSLESIRKFSGLMSQ